MLWFHRRRTRRGFRTARPRIQHASWKANVGCRLPMFSRVPLMGREDGREPAACQWRARHDWGQTLILLAHQWRRDRLRRRMEGESWNPEDLGPSRATRNYEELIFPHRRRSHSLPWRSRWNFSMAKKRIRAKRVMRAYHAASESGVMSGRRCFPQSPTLRMWALIHG